MAVSLNAIKNFLAVVEHCSCWRERKRSKRHYFTLGPTTFMAPVSVGHVVRKDRTKTQFI